MNTYDTTVPTCENIYVELPVSPQTIRSASSDITLLQINIRGINDLEKFDSLAFFLESLNTHIDVLVVGETWIKEDRSSFYVLNGFSSVFSCRRNSAGGLAVFIREGLQFEELLNITDNGYHHIALRLKYQGTWIHVHGIYRPPDFDIPRFHSFMEQILASTDPSSPLFIMGDMNVATNKQSDTNTEQYLDLLHSYGMVVTNTHITRPSSGNILDHAIARVDDAEHTKNYTIECDLSDHSYVFTIFKSSLKKHQLKTLTRSSVDFRSLNSQFNEFLVNTSFSDDDPNTQLIKNSREI